MEEGKKMNENKNKKQGSLVGLMGQFVDDDLRDGSSIDNFLGHKFRDLTSDEKDRLESEKYLKTAQLAEENGDLDNAIENYRKAHAFGDAGRLAEKIGSIGIAISMYKQSAGLEDKAMELAVKHGYYAEAAELQRLKEQ